MIILISGAPGSGKSTITMETSKVTSSVVIPQDAFYKVTEFDMFPFDKDTKGKYEKPDMIDWDKLITTIEAIPHNVNIIVEGHCLLSCKPLLDMCDHCFFIDINFHTCMKRYVSRNSDNYTTLQLEQKEQYFKEWTWPIHLDYIERHVKPITDVNYIKCNLDSVDKIKEVISLA